MFKRNLTYLSTVNVYVKVTSLAVIPFIARRFSIEDFGVLAMAQSLLGYALDCFDGGIKKIGIRELSRSKEEGRTALANGFFTMRTVLLTVAFLFMNVLGFCLFAEPRNRLIVGIISLSILAYVADITWITDARQNMKLSSLNKIIERSVYLVGSVLGLYLISMNVMAVSFPIAAGVAAAVIWYTWKDTRVTFDRSLISLPQMKEGLIIGLSGIAASLCLTVDMFMIKMFRGTYDLGLYSAATKLFFVVLTFLWVYSYALFPKISAAHADREEIRNILRRHTLILGVLGTISVGTLCLFAETLIKLFFSEKFLVILPLFKTLNMFLIIVFFNVLYSEALNAFDRQRTKFLIIVQALALNVILNLFFIPAFGLLGAVYATALAQLLILGLSYYQINKMYQPSVGRYICVFILLNLCLIKWSLS